MQAFFWITIANGCYLLAYAVRDVFWLRALTVAGALLMAPYYYFVPPSSPTPVAWACVFCAINLYWLVRLWIERRPVILSYEESQLKLLAFPTLNDRDAGRLFSMGRWEDLSEGVSLIAHDNGAKRVSVLYSGLAYVYHGNRCISELGPGQFVGALDRAAMALDLDVIIKSNARVVCWDQSDLATFMSRRLDAALALERTIGFELRRLLDRSLAATPNST